jgi:transcriptional regulator GlxA family with amidase domain
VTVTKVAQRWGFVHHGRFAAAYRARFKAPPSQALRHSGSGHIFTG